MNRRNKKAEESSEGAPEWMTTYSDLVTLLLTFFILLFSMAIIDKQKFAEVAFSLRSSFSNISGGDTFNENNGDSLISITPYENALKEAEETDESDKKENYENKSELNDSESADKKKAAIAAAKVNIEKLIKDMGLTENIKVIEEEDIVIFRVDSLILFDTGKADLKDTAKPVIEKMGSVLEDLKTDILVQGHADDRPISTAIFPSNWELSTKRATNVVKHLVEFGGMEQKYLTATGNAEFKPIVPNDTEYNRQKNRRIDIVIAKQK